ncbi:MAG: Flp pilus assembly protein CpaB [Planctomycetes bacterium]|nr:Flp pilus assembly protein CpaB [Planctomycetota bacterium]
MKWSIVGLFLVGIAAAVSASVMIATIRVAPAAVATQRGVEETQIIVASKSMAAMSIVDASSVSLRTIQANGAPKNCLHQPTDVIGKLLLVPIVEGQVFTSAFFADEKSGARLASGLGKGMRAVSVSLKPEKAGLLYPGCVVDVLVSLNRPSKEGPSVKEAMAMTLLQSVQVLAIDDASVMTDATSADPSASETKTASRRDQRDRLVTLVVNSNQAKALQLAAQYGAISLALRNPLDAAPVDAESTMLSDLADEYTRIVAALGNQHVAIAQNDEPRHDQPAPSAPPAPKNPESASRESSRRGMDEKREVNGAAPIAVAGFAPKSEDVKWETLIARGQLVELVRFYRHGDFGSQTLPGTLQWFWDGHSVSSDKGGK